jgi:hypothetical protein
MDLQTMLKLPRDQVRELAPQTVVWAAGGTRRQAVIEGIDLGAGYYDWSWRRQLGGAALFFDMGVRTLFAPILGPPQAREVGPYRDKLFDVLQRLGDDASLEAYRRMGARVRFYGQQHVPGMADLAAHVEAATCDLGPQTLWWSMVVEQEEEALWDAMQAGMRVGATSLAAAARAFYGEDVAPVDVFIGFGKPQTGYLMPPLLGERAALYWTVFPSYATTEEHLRILWWDYRFGRATWRADKTHRYDDLLTSGLVQRYEQPLILGVGQRIGPFWHPWMPE